MDNSVEQHDGDPPTDAAPRPVPRCSRATDNSVPTLRHGIVWSDLVEQMDEEREARLQARAAAEPPTLGRHRPGTTAVPDPGVGTAA